MVRKILKTLVVFIGKVLLFGTIPLTNVFAETTAMGLKYRIKGDEIAITGYLGNETNVIIPDVIAGYPVTSIDKEAFYYCTNLTSVTIPNSVTEIGVSAFQYCSNLKKLFYLKVLK